MQPVPTVAALLAGICVTGSALSYAAAPPAKAAPAPTVTSAAPARTPTAAAPAPTATAAAPTTSAAPATSAAATSTEELTAEFLMHMNRGETNFDQSWVSLGLLFDEYTNTRAQTAEFTAKRQEAQTNLDAARKEFAPLKAKSDEAQRPVVTELTAARARQAELSATLAVKPPPPPGQETVNQKYREDGTLTPDGPVVNGSSPNPESGDWRSQTAANLAKDRDRRQQYDREMAEYTKRHEAANAELPKVEATIQKDEATLARMQAEVEPEQAPFVGRITTAESDIAAFNQEIQGLQERLKSMEAAFLRVTEPVRLRFNILEWEGDFVRLADLEKVAADLKAQIAATRQRIADEAKTAGKPFPKDWQPSQQSRLDAATALILQARTAQGLKPATPVPAAASTKGAR
jgi:predicted  nucleic acid-binding Zn-ribbon protein